MASHTPRRLRLKIAITGDNHLTTRAKHPERFQALEDIFRQCGQQKIQLLLIAGDLFDQSLANYHEFEELYRAARPDDLATVIIPGNHDRHLRGSALAGEGLQVYSEPTLKPLNDSRGILFLPYQENQTMGEAIAPFADQLTGQRWILVGHGDWTKGVNSADPYEPGVYMPLTGADLRRYQPEIVFLGHIHIPQDSAVVYYPGSPCPLNITETGLRRFLILDTDQGKITSQRVEAPLVYYDEHFFMLPGDDDLIHLERDITQRIESWNLPRGWENRVQVRLKISGSASSDRQKILASVKELFAPYSLYQDSGPNLADLVHSKDPDRTEIALQVKDWVDKLDWQEKPGNPAKSLILECALRMIYRTN